MTSRIYEIITEADARTLEIGSTVELAAGGIITPLAKDTLRERRITVVSPGALDPALEAGLAPVADIRRVTIGNDHSGIALKKTIVQHLRGRGLAVLDVGTDKADPVDYPDTAGAVARSVRRSPPTRYAACAPRCAWTRPPRGTRASTTASTSSVSERRCCRAPTPRFESWTCGWGRRCARRATFEG
jgi:hypothetical protein